MIFSRVEPARRKRQVSEQRLTLARGQHTGAAVVERDCEPAQELEAQSNRVGTASSGACHSTPDSEHRLKPRKRVPRCVRGSTAGCGGWGRSDLAGTSG